MNPAEQPILYLALDSTTLPMYTVNEYAETLLAQRISMVSGVSRVSGLRRAEIRRARAGRSRRSWPRAASESMKCSARSQTSNTNLPTGRLDGDKQAFTIQSTGTLTECGSVTGR